MKVGHYNEKEKQNYADHVKQADRRLGFLLGGMSRNVMEARETSETLAEGRKEHDGGAQSILGPCGPSFIVHFRGPLAKGLEGNTQKRKR